MGYIIQGFGDLADPSYNGGYKAGLHVERSFPSLDTALAWLEGWAGEWFDGEWRIDRLDPEDDMVLIYEVLGDGTRVAVWGFFGWHYSAEDYELEQGSFLGHDKSVYSELMEDY